MIAITYTIKETSDGKIYTELSFVEQGDTVKENQYAQRLGEAFHAAIVATAKLYECSVTVERERGQI